MLFRVISCRSPLIGLYWYYLDMDWPVQNPHPEVFFGRCRHCEWSGAAKMEAWEAECDASDHDLHVHWPKTWLRRWDRTPFPPERRVGPPRLSDRHQFALMYTKPPPPAQIREPSRTIRIDRP